MLMANKLIYEDQQQQVLPVLGKVLPGRRCCTSQMATTLALGLITYVRLGSSLHRRAPVLPALLLLAVFSIVNVAC